MLLIWALLIVNQEPAKSEHDIGEEVIKGAIKMRIDESMVYLEPAIDPFAPLESLIAQERYIFDEKLYATIDAINTPILYLHSEYLRIPLVERFMYGSIALFVPRFERTVSSWELVVTDANGKSVRRYAERGLPPPSISWDGRTDDGEMCNMGEVYNYVFSAFDAVGNPTRITGRSYTFNGIVYEDNQSTIIAVSSGVLFGAGTAAPDVQNAAYLDEIANIIKEKFKKEVVVYSYSESEALARQRGEAVMNELVNRSVLPATAIKNAPRFISGLLPKYSKVEIVIQ